MQLAHGAMLLNTRVVHDNALLARQAQLQREADAFVDGLRLLEMLGRAYVGTRGFPTSA